MYEKLYRCIRAVFLIVALLTTIAANGIALYGMGEPANTSSGDFQQILDAVAHQNHVSIVAEGRPLNDPLSGQAESALELKLSSSKDVDEKIASIAAAYDYSWRVDGAGMFLLSKLYTDSRDLPYVTPEEAATDFRRIIACINSISGVTNDPNTASVELKGLQALLSRDQLESLVRGLPVGELSDVQRDQLWLICCHTNFDNVVDNLARSITFLQALKSSSARFRYVDSPLFNQKVFAIDGPFWLNGRQVQFGASYGYEISEYSPGALIAPTGHVFLMGEPDQKSSPPLSDRMLAVFHQNFPGPPYQDPDAPSYEDRKLADEDARPCETVGDLFGRLGSKSVQGTSSISRVIIDPFLTAKPITVAGEEYANLIRLARAIAAVYGLEVAHTAKDTYRIQCVSNRMPNSLAELPAAIRASFPVPLEHALAGHFKADLATALDEAKSHGKNAHVVNQYSIENGTALKSYHEAIRRIRAIVGPQIDSGPNASVVIATCDANVQRLLTLTSVTEWYANLSRFVNNPVPAFIFDFAGDSLFVPQRAGGGTGVNLLIRHGRGENVALSGLEFRWPVEADPGKKETSSGSASANVRKN